MFAKGRYEVREAQSPADLRAAQALRQRAFHGQPGLDVDAFDPLCRHILIEETATGRLVCCFRVLLLPDASHIKHSYSAQFYDLSALTGFPGPLLEMGRFCVDPDSRDPDVLRLAWGALTRFVDAHGVTLLFGCASFVGTEHAPYDDAFAVLKARHLAPRRWLPQIKAFFETEDTEFMLVGNLHLHGKDGILKQLSDDGYVVTQIN